MDKKIALLNLKRRALWLLQNRFSLNNCQKEVTVAKFCGASDKEITEAFNEARRDYAS